MKRSPCKRTEARCHRAEGPSAHDIALTILPALLAAGLFSACAAVGPDYRAQRIAAPAAWRADMTAGLAAETVNPDTSAQWWRQLGDPGLSALIEQVSAANMDLRSARARLLEARARRAMAGAALLPAVGASVTGRRSSGTPGARSSNTLYAAGFDASWELDIFGATRRSVEAAQADLEADAALLDWTRVSLVAEAALNYIEVRTLQVRLGIGLRNLASQSETLQLTEWRSQAGLVGSLDVEQARTNLEQTRAQLPRLEISLAEAHNRLLILSGQQPGAPSSNLARPGAIPVPPHHVAVGIPADALRRRPDVRAAERRLAAEAARLGQAQAARFPGVGLSGSIGLESLTLGKLLDGTVTRSFAASLGSTIFDAGRLAQQVRAQDAVRAQALIAFQASVLAALGDVENALVSFARSRERETALAAAAAAARNAALLARDRYTSGLIDFQTVLDTERTVLSIEDNLAGAQADGTSAVIRLYKALGGGWSPARGEIP
ncbi:MAG: efflux transporter outer membrane subunit [Telluria sp.]|nr:efflux transporter outer membrane subunit [Telluria sp.]